MQALTSGRQDVLPPRKGFSLVELSIVLVILGLLVGGVLSGQSLIRAAEMRSVSSDFQKYSAAINSFRDKYFGLPGDITNATQFWGIAAGATGNDSTCYTFTTTGKATCNGDGNGHLYSGDVDAGGSAPEWFHAWQQLANAGFIEGQYSGVKKSGTVCGAVAGVNVPRSRMSGGGFTLMSYDPAGAGDTQWWFGKYDGFFFGANSVAGYETHDPILKSEEAWNIDTKVDDGNPATGSVRDLVSTDAGDSSCNSTTNPTTARYNLSNSTVICSLFMGFNPPGNQ